MHRNTYDSDVTVWSPQGRLFQVEYAIEAVKLGTVTVGIKNKDYAVVVGLQRASSLQLCLSQRKIFSIDEYLGVAISGLTADARVLNSYLRSQCQSYKHAYDSSYPIVKLMVDLGNKMQLTTQRYNRRPYGVGLLVAGYDEMGPHIFQVMPSANFFNCKAMSIGTRSQSARTYLEREMANFYSCSKEELILHAVKAIHSTLTVNEMDDDKSILVSVGIVGKNEPFHILSDSESKHYQDIVKASGFKPSHEPNVSQTTIDVSEDEAMDIGEPRPSSDEPVPFDPPMEDRD